MKAIDIILQSAYFLNDEDVISAINSNNYASNDKVSFYLRCLNLVNLEIATHYYPIEKLERKVPINEKINTSLLFRQHIRIAKITDPNGNNVRFRCISDEIVLFDNHAYVDILYHAAPQTLEINSNLEYVALPDLRTFSFAVACEHCIVDNLFDEASVWDRRYKQSLQTDASRYKSGVLPIRRWV